MATTRYIRGNTSGVVTLIARAIDPDGNVINQQFRVAIDSPPPVAGIVSESPFVGEVVPISIAIPTETEPEQVVSFTPATTPTPVSTAIPTETEQIVSFTPATTQTPTTVFGCTNPSAINYNPNATTDDGSCQFQTVGGTNFGFGDNTQF
jgi:hypothetical protein